MRPSIQSINVVPLHSIATFRILTTRNAGKRSAVHVEQTRLDPDTRFEAKYRSNWLALAKALFSILVS